MTTKISVTVEGLDELKRKLADTPKPMKRMMFQLRGHALKHAREAAKPHAGDTGKLASLIKGSVSGVAIAPTVRISISNPIAEQVERGRSSGNAPSVGAIRRWGKPHGIPQEAARAIQKSIKAKGSEGVHYMEKTAEDAGEKLPEFIREAEAQIERDFN